MAKNFKIVKDANGQATFAIPFPESTKSYDFLISADTNFAWTIPADIKTGGFNIVLFAFSGGTDVFVRPDSAAVLPTGTSNQRLQELNPQARVLTLSETSLNFISDTASYVSLSFYTGNKL